MRGCKEGKCEGVYWCMKTLPGMFELVVTPVSCECKEKRYVEGRRGEEVEISFIILVSHLFVCQHVFLIKPVNLVSVKLVQLLSHYAFHNHQCFSTYKWL